MSIASLSVGSPAWSSPSKNLAVSETRPPHSRDRCCDASEGPRDSERPARLNPLVAAMMEALGSLFRSSARPAQPATPTAAATPSGTAPAPSPRTDTAGAPTADASIPASPRADDLREAALAFAYELYGALHGDHHGRDHGHGHGRKSEDGYRDHSGRHGGGYDNLAQRLTALAQKLDPAQPAPVAAPATPVAAGSPAPTSAGAASPATDTRDGIQITININLGGRGSMASPATDEPREAPLLSAFKTLLAALDPAATQEPSALQSPQAKLAAFLRQIAQSLTVGTGEAAPSMPASGSLLSVSA